MDVEPLRLAVLSMHTSPFARLGEGDGGGMNVFVRELTSNLAHLGLDCTVYVRANHAGLPDEIDLEPGARVVYIRAGRYSLEKEELLEVVDSYTYAALADIEARGGVDVIHAHYWLSGISGHLLKHELDRPLVTTFHTLARVKKLGGVSDLPRRAAEEEYIAGCSDVICATGQIETEQLKQLYGVTPQRLRIVPPGVASAFFSPGDRGQARQALGLGEEPILLFVGRVQPLKGLDLAVEVLGELGEPKAKLLVVGGPSGRSGAAHMALVRRRCEAARNCDRVVFLGPQPHNLLSTIYRAADVVLVPSRSESFGLVALEAAACGTPVVAAKVGGLKALVDHGQTGFLIEERDPKLWAAQIREILDHGDHAASLSAKAARRAAGYSWEATARRLSAEYTLLRDSRLVDCVSLTGA